MICKGLTYNEVASGGVAVLGGVHVYGVPTAGCVRVATVGRVGRAQPVEEVVRHDQPTVCPVPVGFVDRAEQEKRKGSVVNKKISFHHKKKTHAQPCHMAMSCQVPDMGDAHSPAVEALQQ